MLACINLAFSPEDSSLPSPGSLENVSEEFRRMESNGGISITKTKLSHTLITQNVKEDLRAIKKPSPSKPIIQIKKMNTCTF